ncbi:MAG: tetratricopeptide repeat protein [Planctomycetota bacterium JB042]
MTRRLSPRIAALVAGAALAVGCRDDRAPAEALPLGPAEEATLRTATRHLERGHMGEAYATLEPLLARTPPPVEAQYFAGVAASKLRRYEEAAERLSDAVARDPKLWPQMVELGFVHESLGDFDRAIETYRKVLDAAPGKRRARFGLGRVALERGDVALAKEHLERVLKDDPTFVAARYQLARALVDERDWERALVEIDETLRARPSHDQAHYLRATVLARLGRDAEAEAALEKRAEVYKKKERISGLLEQTMHGRDTAAVHATIARLYLDLDDVEEAATAVRVGLAKFPGDLTLTSLQHEVDARR